MSTRDHTTRVCRGLCTAFLSLWLTGCVASTGNPLQAGQAEQVRRLAADCYWRHEGARHYYGGLQVHVACRNWARDVVSVGIADRRP